MSLPDDLNRAIQLHQSGQLQEAEKAYRHILAAAPQHSDANHLLGLLAYQGGFHEQAIELISLAIAGEASQAIYHNSIGLAYRDSSQSALAITSFLRALALNPNYGEAQNNLGLSYLNAGDDENAIAAFKKALVLAPQLIDAQGNLGNAYKNTERYSDAITCYRAVIKALPGHAPTHCNLGVALQKSGAMEEAVASYKHALMHDPNHLEAHINWGLAEQELGQLADAIVHFQSALSLVPTSVEALSNLGIASQQQDNLDEARSYIEQALALQPTHAKAQANLGVIELEQGYPDLAVSRFEKALEIEPNFITAHSNLLLSRLYLTDTDRQQNLTLARQINAMIPQRRTVHTNEMGSERQLRVGFVSADLRQHAVSSFLASVWAELNTDAIAIYAYATSHTDDEVTQRLRVSTTAWRKFAGLTPEAQCKIIGDDKIDILVDLGGHTAYNAIALFAQKPAPIQITWLGYSATTGLDTIDYILADPYVLPKADGAQYSETPWRLRESYLCFTPPDVDVLITDGPAKTNGYITFGSFNNLSKLTDQTIACWVQVLQAIPESRLLLKAKQLSSELYRKALVARFTEAGLDPARLQLMPRTSGLEAHLDAYNQMDIALDTFPYAGTTTTAEALWMGVPVLALQGDRFVARVGESLLTNTGLADWIATSPDDIVEKAKQFAAAPGVLNDLRHRLRAQFVASPVCDAPRFAAELQAAFTEMWKIHCRN